MLVYFIILVLVDIVSGLNSEGEALISLMKRMGVPKSIKLSWNSSDSTPCYWQGIRCDNEQRLVSVSISNYNISGQLGKEIGSLKFLEKFDLSMNNLSGMIPPELGDCSHLQHLDLSTNRLQGRIPLEMMNLYQLRNISLYNNNFSGVIPHTLGINTSLQHLDFTNNKFSGEIPPNLCFQNQLKVLHLGQNHLHGSIPSGLGSCSSLQRLILRHNNLTGLLPHFAENYSLVFLDISGNHVNGTIPPSLGNCTNLASINLSMNNLTGGIPKELGDLVELQKLDLSDNHLQGPLPPQLSNNRKLYSLDVGFNSLNGSIPSSLETLTQLSTLILRENKFGGAIPGFFAQFRVLVELQLGGNSLGGPIPPSLGELKNLVYTLNLSGNRLTGPIPQEFQALNVLESLDLSFNNLTGSLELLLGLPSLLEVNVSYNLFYGSLSDRLLQLLKSPSSFLGNPNLNVRCVLAGSGFIGHSNFNSCDSGPRNPKGLNRGKLTMMVVGSFLLCVFMILISTYMFGRCRRNKNGSRSEFFPRTYPISLKDVLKATDNLNEKFVIGRGAHGTVYKAVFDSGCVLAVKKLIFSGHKGANVSMRREIQTVGTIKHRNLVRLEDFWYQMEYGLILYEYMTNGSLHDVLHEITPAPFITWDVRYRIALGTAEGLAYLHNDCNPSVVHQDIKPKNILLDSGMEPHISDFGIAKLMDHSPASIRTITVIGTVGYIAPEIAFTMTKNKGTDVYSYGVVLLELITRKKVMDRSFPEDMNIVKWAHTTWNRKKVINGIVDESIVGEFTVPEVKEEMKKVLLIALQCSEKEPRKRPTMRDVVKQLKDAKAVTSTVG